VASQGSKAATLLPAQTRLEEEYANLDGVRIDMQDESIRSSSGAGTHAEAEDGDAKGVVIARSELIGLGGSDESVVSLQLAARWAEKYGPENEDSLEDALRRFRRAYNYVNSVIKLVEPEEL
jgi:hypothetical protein